MKISKIATICVALFPFVVVCSSACDPDSKCDSSGNEPVWNVGPDQEVSCLAAGFETGNVQCIDCNIDFKGCGVCGDGKLGGSEECDGNIFNFRCRESPGYQPELSQEYKCKDCKLDVENCFFCGDNRVRGDEQCDGKPDPPVKCSTITRAAGEALYTSGNLGCTDCKYNFDDCDYCGNDEAGEGEECDGSDHKGKTCESFDLSGKLSCNSKCKFDKSRCYTCGDSKVTNPPEMCDGENLDGETCKTQGFERGHLACLHNCLDFNRSDCSTCGDRNITGAEVCEVDQLNGQTCQLQDPKKYNAGTLKCSYDCLGFDHSGCSFCGDNKITADEPCDGSNLDGKQCSDFGFAGGKLACDKCQAFDFHGCNGCGNDLLEEGEQCDTNQKAGQTCQSIGDFTHGDLKCSNTCVFDQSGCYKCPSGKLDHPDKQCDGSNLNKMGCVGLGFGGGKLSCNSDCQFNTTLCEPLLVQQVSAKEDWYKLWWTWLIVGVGVLLLVVLLLVSVWCVQKRKHKKSPKSSAPRMHGDERSRSASRDIEKFRVDISELLDEDEE